jgi:hypothetical protein
VAAGGRLAQSVPVKGALPIAQRRFSTPRAD